MSRMKEMQAPVPWPLQRLERVWSEDECLRHDPDAERLEGAWRRLFGAPLPATLERWSGGDIFYHWCGGDHVWAVSYDGHHIFKIPGTPTIWEVREAMAALDAAAARLGVLPASLEPLSRREIISSLPDRHRAGARVIANLDAMAYLRWCGRRELPVPERVEAPSPSSQVPLAGM